MDLNELIKNQEDVSLTLAKQLISKNLYEEEYSNTIFSPLSINVLLGLVAAGSTGSTRYELLAFLKSNSVDDFNKFFSQTVSNVFADGSSVGGPCLSVANSAWIEKSETIKPSFKHVAESVYHATINSIDFKNKAKKVTKEVNKWVKKETNGLINDIIGPGSLDQETRLLLVNALYFKGVWTKKFEPSLTKKKKFHLLNGDSIKVPFMSSDKKQYVEEYDDFKVLRRPYQQGEDYKRSFSMCIFLPNAKKGLQSLLDKVCSESGFVERHIPHTEIEMLEFRIPKFEISFDFEAKSVLEELGVVSPFSQEEGMTEMVESPLGLYVTNIIQKAFIKVDEEGTEAAAVTVMRGGFTSCWKRPRPKKIKFVANRPFLFLIRDDRTGIILFVGTVVNPLLE